MTAPQRITERELAKIRSLDDFDLKMLVGEISDHGWGVARETLEMMPQGTRPA